MIKFALVGNIASGKSTVEKFLEEFGYPVLDTDVVCHNLLKCNLEVKSAFKDYDVFENGEISRVKLGKLVFSDKNLKQKLENILHPLVKEKIFEFFEQNKSQKYSFVSIPLLFETKMENLFDKIIFIYTNDDIRLKRLMSRNNYTKEYAQIRMNSQISQDEKVKKSDFVIYNNSDLDSLKQEISNLIG